MTFVFRPDPRLAAQVKLKMATSRTGKCDDHRDANVALSPTLIDTVCQRLARNLRVRQTLPGKGRLHIDRQLPFLFV